MPVLELVMGTNQENLIHDVLVFGKQSYMVHEMDFMKLWI